MIDRKTLNLGLNHVDRIQNLSSLTMESKEVYGPVFAPYCRIHDPFATVEGVPSTHGTPAITVIVTTTWIYFGFFGEYCTVTRCRVYTPYCCA